MGEVHVPLSLQIRYILRGENFHQERIDSGKMAQHQQKGPYLQESEGSLADERGPRDHHIANTMKICSWRWEKVSRSISVVTQNQQLILAWPELGGSLMRFILGHINGYPSHSQP